MCLREISASKCERCCCCAGVISLDCLHLLLLLFGASGLRCYEPAGHACCNSLSCYRIFSPAALSLRVAPQQVPALGWRAHKWPAGRPACFVLFAILCSDRFWELGCFIFFFFYPFHHKIAKMRILSQLCTRGNCARTLLHKHRNNFKSWPSRKIFKIKTSSSVFDSYWNILWQAATASWGKKNCCCCCCCRQLYRAFFLSSH